MAFSRSGIVVILLFFTSCASGPGLQNREFHLTVTNVVHNADFAFTTVDEALSNTPVQLVFTYTNRVSFDWRAKSNDKPIPLVNTNIIHVVLERRFDGSGFVDAHTLVLKIAPGVPGSDPLRNISPAFADAVCDAYLQECERKGKHLDDSQASKAKQVASGMAMQGGTIHGRTLDGGMYYRISDFGLKSKLFNALDEELNIGGNAK